jgi:hypothetical protein
MASELEYLSIHIIVLKVLIVYTIGKLVNINKYTILVGGFNPSEYPEISINNKYPLNIH